MRLQVVYTSKKTKICILFCICIVIAARMEHVMNSVEEECSVSNNSCYFSLQKKIKFACVNITFAMHEKVTRKCGVAIIETACVLVIHGVYINIVANLKADRVGVLRASGQVHLYAVP